MGKSAPSIGLNLMPMRAAQAPPPPVHSTPARTDNGHLIALVLIIMNILRCWELMCDRQGVLGLGVDLFYEVLQAGQG